MPWLSVAAAPASASTGVSAAAVCPGATTPIAAIPAETCAAGVRGYALRAARASSGGGGGGGGGGKGGDRSAAVVDGVAEEDARLGAERGKRVRDGLGVRLDAVLHARAHLSGDEAVRGYARRSAPARPPPLWGGGVGAW